MSAAAAIAKAKERGALPVPKVEEVKAQIPKELFEHSVPRALFYLSKDLVQAGALWYAASYIDAIPEAAPALWWTPYVLWPIMWWLLGVVLTGWWVLAHECGHGGFSQYKELNDLVGWVLHSFLLVPYWSWAITHGQHHKHTNLCGGDTVFVPVSKSRWRRQMGGIQDWLNGTFVPSVAGVVVMLTIGWPAYLISNVTGLEQQYTQGKNKRAKQPAHHFSPASHYFHTSERMQVILSDVGVFAMLALVAYWGFTNGWWWAAKYYIIPYLWVNHWLVLITYLQHTHPEVPHYTSASWNFMKGATSTVDRSYGWFLNHCMHHIQDSHVAHHMFSDMPFYNALKATPYIKKALGPLYFSDDTHYYKAALFSWINCQYVPDEGDVLPYLSDSPLQQ